MSRRPLPLHELRQRAAVPRGAAFILCRRAQIAARCPIWHISRAARPQEHHAQRPPPVSATASQSLRRALAAISSSSSVAASASYRAATPANTLSSNFAQRSFKSAARPAARPRGGEASATESACADAAHVLRPAGGDSGMPPAAQQLDAHALAELLHGEEFHGIRPVRSTRRACRST